MDLSTFANVATALTVLTAVAFGLLETRRARRSLPFKRFSLPNGSTASAIEADAHVLAAVQAIGVILEGLGYSVYARIVPLQVVGDLMGGTVRLAWRKVRPYVEEERRRIGSQNFFEWFQWLSTQLERYSPGKTNLEIGAHQAYQDWKP